MPAPHWHNDSGKLRHDSYTGDLAQHSTVANDQWSSSRGGDPRCFLSMQENPAPVRARSTVSPILQTTFPGTKYLSPQV